MGEKFFFSIIATAGGLFSFVMSFLAVEKYSNSFKCSNTRLNRGLSVVNFQWRLKLILKSPDCYTKVPFFFLIQYFMLHFHFIFSVAIAYLKNNSLKQCHIQYFDFMIFFLFYFEKQYNKNVDNILIDIEMLFEIHRP